MENNDEVTVTTSGGGVYTAELVIGADGVKSTVRSFIDRAQGVHKPPKSSDDCEYIPVKPLLCKLRSKFARLTNSKRSGSYILQHLRHVVPNPRFRPWGSIRCLPREDSIDGLYRRRRQRILVRRRRMPQRQQETNPGLSSSKVHDSGCRRNV